MMNIGELIGRDVMDLSTATTAGRIDDAIIDPQTRQVRGFVIGKGAGDGTWLDWSAIKSIGPDAVTVERGDVITAAPNDLGTGCRDALNRRVLTDQGFELGLLSTIDVNQDSGAVDALVLDDRRLPADQLVGIGSYATVVHDPGIT